MLTKHLGVLTGTSLHFFLYIIYISSILIFIYIVEMDSFFTIVGYTYQNQSLITGVDVSFIPGKVFN